MILRWQALHFYNSASFFFTPIYIAAVATVLVLAWLPPQRDWELLRYFLIQIGLEAFGWCMVLKIDADVRAWKTQYDKVRDGGNYSHHVALALSDVDEKTQLLRRHVAPGVAVLEVLE